MGDPTDHPTTMLYDRDCGICTASARWLARRVPVDRLRLLAIAEAGTDARIAALVADRPLSSSLHVVRADGRVVTGAAAVLVVGREVPRWRVAAVALDHRLGRLMLEPAYRILSRNRRRIGRLLRLPEVCAVSTEAHVRS